MSKLEQVKTDHDSSKGGGGASEQYIEDVGALSSAEQLDQDFSDIDKKRFLWKVDLHLIPWLCVLYRASLSSCRDGEARISHLGHLSSSIFVIQYCLSWTERPSATRDCMD